MKICVQGLWHLGTVTAASLAKIGHDVIGLDYDANLEDLKNGIAPLHEPGLNDLLGSVLDGGNLKFTSFFNNKCKDCDFIWITYDTPVDDNDWADYDEVIIKIKKTICEIEDKANLIISSQIPVGTVKNLEKYVFESYPNKEINFAYVPENLRLGNALNVFLNPDRIVVGTRDGKSDFYKRLLLTISSKLELMSIESAEMTKHAINSFLATSITFINEIASISEYVGADAKQVERGLKSEMRIGPKAYLSPGGPFAGGTLARDVEFLNILSKENVLCTPLLSSIKRSNDEHKKWIYRKLKNYFPSSMEGISVAMWGLSYKAGTSTLRRSLALDLCDWLLSRFAKVTVYDPAITKRPEILPDLITLEYEALDAVKGARVLIVNTDSPEFKKAAKVLLDVALDNIIVFDANRYIKSVIENQNIEYVAVGTCINNYEK